MISDLKKAGTLFEGIAGHRFYLHHDSGFNSECEDAKSRLSRTQSGFLRKKTPHGKKVAVKDGFSSIFRSETKTRFPPYEMHHPEKPPYRSFDHLKSRKAGPFPEMPFLNRKKPPQLRTSVCYLFSFILSSMRTFRVIK